MLETLITSQTRIKLLLKFFLNSNSSSYLRHLETEFGESTNSIRVELNRFEKAGLLKSFTRGNRKYFQANNHHPLFNDIHNIILKYVGIDKVIENVVHNLGDLEKAFPRANLPKDWITVSWILFLWVTALTNPIFYVLSARRKRSYTVKSVILCWIKRSLMNL